MKNDILLHVKSDNGKIMINNYADEIIQKLFIQFYGGEGFYVWPC